MPLRLRSAREGDAATVASLQLSSWRDAYRGLLDDGFLDGEAGGAIAAHWAGFLATKPSPGLVIVATLGGDPAGFVAARRRDRTALVDSLHVRPGLRGAGIGRALIGLAAQRLRGRGCTGAELGVVVGNARALRFYLGLGAELGQEVEATVFGIGLRERRCLWPDIGILIGRAAAR